MLSDPVYLSVAPFADLQQRLNRKTVSAKALEDYPAFVRLYDILLDGAEDVFVLGSAAHPPRHAAHFDGPQVEWGNEPGPTDRSL